MCVLELVGHKLAVHGAGLQAGSGGQPDVTPAELAGMLAGLERGPVAMAYAKFALDAGAARTVYALLHVIASNWSRHEKWDVPRGSGRVGKLARMVRDDLILTRPILSGRQAGALLGISESAWRQTWRARHGRLWDVGMEWEWALQKKLVRELYWGHVEM